MSIRCYLLFNSYTYSLHITLDYKNLKFKYLIDDIVIEFWSIRNFTRMKNIRRTCNLIVDLEKFTSNKNKLSGVVVVGYNQVFSQTLSLKKLTWIHILKI